MLSVVINHLSKQKMKVRGIKSSSDIRDWNAGNLLVALIHPAGRTHSDLVLGTVPTD